MTPEPLLTEKIKHKMHRAFGWNIDEVFDVQECTE
jgi:hypothetical protein